MGCTLATVCFKHPNAFGCSHEPPYGLIRDQVMSLVERGSAKCERCGKVDDLRAHVRDFPLFGIPEALFGLDVWHGRKVIPPSNEHRIVSWDIGIELPHEGTVLYAHATAQVDDSSHPGPRLLAQQNSHARWPLQLAIYAPPSERETALGMIFVMTPEHPLESALDLAVQAVGQFHRGQLGVASVLLTAAIEMSLRTRLSIEYAKRNVKLDDRATLTALLERARLLLEPAPGPKLTDEVQRLAGHARNPAAHGRPVDVTREDVAGWMVATAVVYEWTRLAQSIYSL